MSDGWRTRPGERQAFVPGRRPVEEALKAGRARKIVWAGDAKGLHSLLEMARQQGVPVEETTVQELDRLSRGARHQGIGAVVEPYRLLTLSELLEGIPPGEVPLLVAAGLEDPRNLGALIRSAHAAGAHGLILPSRRAAPLTPAVEKAAAGALAYLPVAQVPGIPQALQELKKKGLWVVGADPQARLLYWDLDLTLPVVLVVGSEGKGLPRLVKERCDFLAAIPMAGPVGSLNASVAGALFLFEARRQRRA
ncbi:MAG: 23S rRNA (guanosine(2251)-2'-O)-methyltransferase RlmB [Clostridiales bacterium]|nr:23S rRNA (guanosine(2251)-2'-O)-methyltransferase RlmB [Clostridiales bacterium]